MKGFFFGLFLGAVLGVAPSWFSHDVSQPVEELTLQDRGGLQNFLDSLD